MPICGTVYSSCFAGYCRKINNNIANSTSEGYIVHNCSPNPSCIVIEIKVVNCLPFLKSGKTTSRIINHSGNIHIVWTWAVIFGYMFWNLKSDLDKLHDNWQLNSTLLKKRLRTLISFFRQRHLPDLVTTCCELHVHVHAYSPGPLQELSLVLESLWNARSDSFDEFREILQ